MTSTNPFPPDGPGTAIVSVTWDYVNEVVADKNHFSLFSTTWEYSYNPAYAQRLRWSVSRCPGDAMHISPNDVPEMVRLAVMVST